MVKKLDKLANEIFAWINAEDDEWRKNAYILARDYAANGPLRDYLTGLMEAGDTAALTELRNKLDEGDRRVLASRVLPWTRIWQNVAIDLCTYLSEEFTPDEEKP